eukprot:CAMPEP_0113879806 /NCGR_PEP_ID=MMETSP0780_2-20120614/7436_1 /TAXON_ID=652834 /ORGANISM="Palpitomonas bilix" /LENGTH=75 /DNA_ID=CAMNT_0000866415 /DNA_START=68 /DNA_END=295 /DNA_ORIENTATION=+ /assembly_acc=CAM_ASM_000599
MSDAPESEGEGFQDEGFEAGGEISEAMHRTVEDALVTYALDDAKTAFLEGRFAVLPATSVSENVHSENRDFREGN